MEADFSGYATKAGLKCSDGRIIMPDAFKENDGMKVPLVWQHGHKEPANVLGHAVLENRADGVYAYGYFNDTTSALNAKTLVQHEDVNALSIYANRLVEKGNAVMHGMIREVSLVLSGANPGAFIDFISLAHADGEIEVLEDEAIIYSGLSLEHEDVEEEEEQLVHADGDGKTVQDVYDSMDEEQKNVLHYMIGVALEEQGNSAEHSDTDEDALEHQEGTDDMSRNVFEQNSGTATQPKATLTHAQIREIVTDAQKMGSFKEAFLAHAVDYGIENIDILFPDARTIANSPEFVSRRMEWVSSVINGTKHSPFSRIKSISADITHDEARAKGYVKGTLKKEEWFGLASRVTTPTTIYKKQKLDRDDIIDITDLDVVAWLKAEMRVMLDEELARAVLIGDGRAVDDEDKINEQNIRPIAKDDDFYTHKIVVGATVEGEDLIEAVLRGRTMYRGTGNPTMYTTEAALVELLLLKDTTGRRLYPTQSELQSALRVSSIVPVEVLEGEVDASGAEILAILVNLSDYVLGADKGGNVSMFDDFDIDYNQYKYLIETRCSGALTKFKSAQVISRSATAASSGVTPEAPNFNQGTNTVTIPPRSAEYFYEDDLNNDLSGTSPVLTAGQTLPIWAVIEPGYTFAEGAPAYWTFTGV